jgi:hypothetical protein
MRSGSSHQHVIYNYLASHDVSQNPGNNLHVSGLSSRVDTRDLEAAFAKIGRVSDHLCLAIQPEIDLS